ncbi:hypothetical protein AvCA_39710 [Azotobacter vinelandii CA]|uniref:Uncharacterized protein n=2 Tax=Azotobacter vinelandii TaxID=354 RepID=C1DE02_AZOVD|nr:hypothetical protein Avin_39710 [Azotobacter vinelandii DJ]AGK16108.1 hypothetical protein AvCA_39710 [Azotobacter vinelandii CA]AGK21700.1 hypothetical protein AvCA6_39710 [Azotobacter vinelandii CA6]
MGVRHRPARRCLPRTILSCFSPPASLRMSAVSLARRPFSPVPFVSLRRADPVCPRLLRIVCFIYGILI